MKTISLQTGDGRGVAIHVRIADTFASRSIGLLRERVLEEQHGMLFMPGGSIHTFGMRFPIDVVFLDRRMRVLNMSVNVAPNGFRLAPPQTARVLELAAGRVARVGLLIGTFIVGAHEFPEHSRSLTPARPSAPCQRLPVQFTLRLPPPPMKSHLGATRDPACHARRITDAARVARNG